MEPPCNTSTCKQENKRNKKLKRQAQQRTFRRHECTPPSAGIATPTHPPASLATSQLIRIKLIPTTKSPSPPTTFPPLLSNSLPKQTHSPAMSSIVLAVICFVLQCIIFLFVAVATPIDVLRFKLDTAVLGTVLDPRTGLTHRACFSAWGDTRPAVPTASTRQVLPYPASPPSPSRGSPSAPPRLTLSPSPPRSSASLSPPSSCARSAPPPLPRSSCPLAASSASSTTQGHGHGAQGQGSH